MKIFGKLIYLLPTRSLRHKARNISHFGFLNYIKTRFKEPRLKFKHYLSVCAIAKNEGCYFREWIEFHRLVGVEKFYIYDNESSDNTRKILAPYIKSGVVEYTYWPGKKRQMPAYEDCVKRHKYDTRWLAFIDLDEFIVPVETDTLPEFMKKFEKFSGLEINWLTYGDGGHKKKTDGLVIERFKKRSASDYSYNRWVKSILNPRFIARPDVHSASYAIGCSADANGNKMKHEGFHHTRLPLCDKIRINHYACKTWEEFSKKRARGDADRKGPSVYVKEYFDQWNRNDLSDPIMDRYIPALRKKLAKK
jgi:hypothetical protein